MIGTLIITSIGYGIASAAGTYAVRLHREKNAKPLICMGSYTLHQWSEWKDCEPKEVRTTCQSFYGQDCTHTVEVETPYQERRCLMCNELERRVVPLAASARL